MANIYSIPYMWSLNLHAMYRYRHFEFGVRINNLTNNK